MHVNILWNDDLHHMNVCEGRMSFTLRYAYTESHGPWHRSSISDASKSDIYLMHQSITRECGLWLPNMSFNHQFQSFVFERYAVIQKIGKDANVQCNPHVLRTPALDSRHWLLAARRNMFFEENSFEENLQSIDKCNKFICPVTTCLHVSMLNWPHACTCWSMNHDSDMCSKKHLTIRKEMSSRASLPTSVFVSCILLLFCALMWNWCETVWSLLSHITVMQEEWYEQLQAYQRSATVQVSWCDRLAHRFQAAGIFL